MSVEWAVRDHDPWGAANNGCCAALDWSMTSVPPLPSLAVTKAAAM